MKQIIPKTFQGGTTKERLKKTLYVFLIYLSALSLAYGFIYGIDIEFNYSYFGAGVVGVIGFNVVCWTIGYRIFKKIIPWGKRRATMQFIGSIIIISLSALICMIFAVVSVVLKMLIPAAVISAIYYFGLLKKIKTIIGKRNKTFFLWHFLKNRLHKKDTVNFSRREIWWCSVGLNIGYEINGKGTKFLRPVLVLKKTSNENFVGLPMTSKGKNLPGYFKYKDGYIILEQVRTFNARRLVSRKEKVSQNNFDIINNSFINYLSPRRGPAPNGDLQ